MASSGMNSREKMHSFKAPGPEEQLSPLEENRCMTSTGKLVFLFIPQISNQYLSALIDLLKIWATKCLITGKL